MKHIITLLLLLPLLVNAQTKYALSVKDSKLHWEGNFPTGKGHHGTLQVSSGHLMIHANGQVTGGDFIIDMRTIKTTDITSKDGGNDLDMHLKSEDFFFVNIFPTATFSFAKNQILRLSATAQTVNGFLTLRGMKNNITFPAVIKRVGNQIKVTAKFSINRARWNVRYQSPTFKNMIKNGVISDEVPISLDLVFNAGK
jgi:polyisoprenoid-binding protein YceI